MLIVEVVLGSFKTGGGYKLLFCMRNWNFCQVFIASYIKVYEVDCICELYHNAAGEESRYRVFRACSWGVFAGPLGQCSFLAYPRWSPGRETHKLVRTWPETHRPRGIKVSNCVAGAVSMLNVGLIVSTSYEKLSESAAAVVADYKLMNAQRRILSFRCAFVEWITVWMVISNGFATLHLPAATR